MRIILLGLFLVGAAQSLGAQTGYPHDAYGDTQAAELVRLARANRALVDTSIRSYSVVAHERFSASGAMGGLERLLLRRETITRIDWTRDTVRIEVLGAREAQPLMAGGALLPPPDLPGMLPALAFDPGNSEMLIQIDSTVIRHPLSAGSEAYYRFATGDTSTIRLHDGREVRLIELRFTARRADPQLIDGSFWLDAESAAIARVGFRLSRPVTNQARATVLQPEVVAELDHVAIDYGYWDLQWWLPRTMVARGVVRAAGFRFPLSYERRYEDYRIEGQRPGTVTIATDSPGADRLCRPVTSGSINIGIGGSTEPAARDSAWNAVFERSAERLASGRRTRPDSIRAAAAGADSTIACARPFLVTRAEGIRLSESPHFEGSIYDERGGPLSEGELRALSVIVNRIPDPDWRPGLPTARILPADMFRYNRVEGFSAGVSATLPIGSGGLTGSFRVGSTGEVGGRIGIHARPGPIRTDLAAYRGLRATEFAAQPLTLSSSLSALVLGRDENDYFRSSGFELRLSPPPVARQSWDLRLYAERQEEPRTRSDFTLRGVFGDFEPRPNLAADRVDQLGGEATLRSARGHDPAGTRVRSELTLRGETGDSTFVRPVLRVTANRQLGDRVALGSAFGAGTALGAIPAQSHLQVGGVATARGHEAAALRGESAWFARGEIGYGPPGLKASLFADAAWAGDRTEFFSARPLHGFGVGLSLFDNLARVDLARGLDGGGTRIYFRLGGGI